MKQESAVTELKESLELSWRYQSDLFEAETIEGMGGNFLTLLEGIVVNPEARISQLLQHPDMVLRRDNFSIFVTNWENKASNIQRIAKELNIGLDSLVFFDDNPAERQIVRQFLPMVAVPEVPENPADYVHCLSDAGYFEATSFSKDDVSRTEQFNPIFQDVFDDEELTINEKTIAPDIKDSIATPSLTQPNKDKDIERLLLIRIFEETLLDLFKKGLLNGTTHTYIGEEYIAVSLMTSVRKGDVVFSNHRGHGHYLARYDDPEGLLAEIMGREGALCHGVGGSQHLYRDNEFISTGVQGESLPLAAGVAWHFKKEGIDGIAMTFIGDGTWGEGIVYETLNLAKLKELPLVVIVENNHISQTIPSSLNLAGTIEARVKAFGIDYLHVTSHDVWECRQLTAPAIDKVRQTSNPLVIEFETDRLASHSKRDDTRSPELIQQLKKHDWFLVLQQKYPEQFKHLLPKLQERIEKIVRDVSSRPFSQWSIE